VNRNIYDYLPIADFQKSTHVDFWKAERKKCGEKKSGLLFRKHWGGDEIFVANKSLGCARKESIT
jgi:hypothetical protein